MILKMINLLLILKNNLGAIFGPVGKAFISPNKVTKNVWNDSEIRSEIKSQFRDKFNKVMKVWLTLICPNWPRLIFAHEAMTPPQSFYPGKKGKNLFISYVRVYMNVCMYVCRYVCVQLVPL